MTEDKFRSMVKDLKSMPILTSYIMGVDPNAIGRMCMAWVCAETRYINDDRGINPWDCVEFDVDKFKRLAECRKIDLFEILVKANILYPDGTFNESIIEELKNGKRKHRKEKGSDDSEGDGEVRTKDRRDLQ